MYHLISKEIFQSKKSIILLFVVGVILMFVDIEGYAGTGFVAFFLSFFIVFLVMSRNEYYEDKNKGYSLLRTLPIKANQIVLSKFILMILLSCGYTLFNLIIFVFIKHQQITSDILYINVSAIYIAIIFAGVFYNMVYKYGAAKAINITRIMFFLLYFGILILVKSIKGGNMLTDLSFIREFGEAILPYLNVYTISALVLIIYALLYFNAVRLFKKSEVV